MEVFRIALTFHLLKNVLCDNAWEIPNYHSVAVQEEAKKTSIVGYNKVKMTKDEIEREKSRIENRCHCKVENLDSVGAFILTYDNPVHLTVGSLGLDPSKEIGVDDYIVTIFNEKIPTDPYFKLQWALQDLNNNADINAAEGWKEYMSDSKGGDPNGPSVVVAVLDTGVDYRHPDLKDVMWTNPNEVSGNGKDDDGNGIIDDVYGADFHYGDGDPSDRHSHGTHCAGIIGAKENNGEGIAGVASFAQGKVKIMAVKILDDWGIGLESNMLKGLNYAIANGASISSNSWGGGYMSNGVEQLWDTVLQNNPEHLFVAAAGNKYRHMEGIFGNSYRTMTCGLKEPNLLCVASSNINDKKSSFSNYGKDYVHVFAPGSDIYSTTPGRRYQVMSGTSMACPHVSGLAALIRTMRPDMNAQKVRKVIEDNVQKKTHYKDVVSSGGLIDMGKTIRASKPKGCLYGREDIEEKASLGDDSYAVQQQGSALLAATYREDIPCMQYLINAGAYIDAKDTWPYRTALYYAVYKKNIQAIDLLLKSGANIDARSNLYWTALVTASVHDFFDMVEYLIRQGADATVVTSGGDTILHNIIWHSTNHPHYYPKPTKSFIFILKKEPNLLEHTNNYGYTPYLAACYTGNQAFLDYLKDVGANIQATTNDEKSCYVLCKEKLAIMKNNGCTPSA